MTCDEVRELLPAFALDALTAEEAREVAAHLETCTEHPEAASLRATAMALSLSAEEREPPAALRSRVLGSIAVEAPAPPPSPMAPLPPPILLSERRTRRWMPLAAIAAAVLVAALGLWQIGYVTFGQTDTTIVRLASTGTIEGRLAYVPAERVAILSLNGIEAPPSGRDYQAWIIRPGQDPAPYGVLRFEGGTARVTLDAALQAGDVVAVTVEPLGGGAKPTSPPIYTSRF